MQKILIVDDDAEIHALVKNSLKEHYEICSAFTLKQAKENLRLEHYDLTILDVMLPDGSGYSLYTEPDPNVKLEDCAVIFLSALDEIDGKAAALRLGAQDYITKPFEIVDLHIKIKNLLASKQKL